MNENAALNEKDILSSSEFRKKLFERIHSISSKFNVSYPINPRIRYEYPEINEITIQNIVNALISCPKFYIQTLHLMNKMNLPCPLVSYVRTARPPLYYPCKNVDSAQLESIYQVNQSSSESEIEIDTEQDSTKRVLNEKKNQSKPKRLKIQSFLKPPNEKEDTNKQKLTEVFESSIETKESKKLHNNKPSVYDRQIVQSVGEGFAKIIPLSGKIPDDTLKNTQPDLNLNTDATTEYIAQNELEKNRMKIADLKELSVYKNYEKGAVSSKLYIKNLAKNVEESNLKFIYGRYVDWSDETHVSAFNIRLMKEGRMKGQAFITFVNENSAEKALNETNGYLLNEKPLIVSFARSAQPK